MDLTDRKFYEHFAAPREGGEAKVVRVYCCPCCGFPTLSEPAGYEICEVCDWEDDGADGYGPNACSLEEAQENFRRYLTSYGPAHEFAPRFQRAGMRFVHQSVCSPAALERRRMRIADLECYMGERDLLRRGELWRAMKET